MEEMRVNISRLVIERDRLSAQRRTREREREIKIVKDQLKEERRRQKRSLRTWRRQEWDSKITECEEANQNGDTGKMYRLLREIGVGQRDSAPPTTGSRKKAHWKKAHRKQAHRNKAHRKKAH